MSKDTWRIVKIIDDYHVVVNAGANNGIKKDDELEIYEIGEPVIDPKTNENLGTLDFIKAHIRVKNVYEKMSLCISADEINIPNIFTQAILSSQIRRKTLLVNAEDISGGLEGSRRIKVGDLVRKSLG